MPKFNPSIRNRMLLTVFVGLLSLVATHVVLNVFLVQTAYNAERDRLIGFARMYSNNFTTNSEGDIIWQEAVPPDPRFNVSNSGLYAAVFNAADELVWSSPSALGSDIPLPPKKDFFNGFFSHGEPSSEKNVYKYYMPMMLNEAGGQASAEDQHMDNKVFYIMVYENGALLDLRVQTISSTVWFMLAVSFFLILAAQTVASRWSVRPLSALDEEIQNVREGKQKMIFGQYPKELEGVTDGFNKLLVHESQQVESYRNALANLAHSLKTPLAVLGSTADGPASLDELKNELSVQLKRMNDMVSYQLSLASRSGRQTFAQPILLEPMCLSLAESLEKLNKHKGAYCEFEIDNDVTIRANKGDMQELIGNLMENAFKWCKNRVALTIREDVVEQELIIIVEDDGQGVAPEHINDIIERGVRADEHVHGHGIGLAIVNDILRAYQGKMVIERSEELGGARFKVTLPI